MKNLAKRKTASNSPRRSAEQKKRELEARTWNLPIVCLLPNTVGKENPSLARLNNRLHRAIRRLLIETEGKKCSACGHVPDKTHPRDLLYGHEVFELDERRHIMRFVKYRILCSDCHRLTHNGYWEMYCYGKNLLLGKEYLELAEKWQKKEFDESKRITEHFCRVNGCTPQEAYSYAGFALDTGLSRLDPRNRDKHWRRDWGALRQYKGKLGSNNATLDNMLSEM